MKECLKCAKVVYMTHEVADLRMIFQLNALTNPADFVIRTSDTAILVIALGHMGSMSSDIN